MNVAPNVAPKFGSLGLSSGAATSNFNIVARPPDTNTITTPAMPRWGLGVMAMLVAAVGIVVQQRRGRRPSTR